MASRFSELLEALNKGEPIDYECKSRLEEHLVACINKTGKDNLGDPRSRAEELLQIHAEQMVNMTGGGTGESGGGSATLNISEKYIPVPVGEPVEKIIFNTSLSNEEVLNILNNCGFPTEITKFADIMFPLFFNKISMLGLYVANMGLMPGGIGESAFVIIGTMGETEAPLWVDPALESEYGMSGWINETFEYFGSNEIAVGGYTSDSTFIIEESGDFDEENISIGTYNNKLARIVNIGTIEASTKELTGTYNSTELEITSNGNIDLVSYIDNKQIPTNINVSVPQTGGTPTVSTEKIPIPNTNGVYAVTIGTWEGWDSHNPTEWYPNLDKVFVDGYMESGTSNPIYIVLANVAEFEAGSITSYWYLKKAVDPDDGFTKISLYTRARIYDAENGQTLSPDPTLVFSIWGQETNAPYGGWKFVETQMQTSGNVTENPVSHLVIDGNDLPVGNHNDLLMDANVGPSFYAYQIVCV